MSSIFTRDSILDLVYLLKLVSIQTSSILTLPLPSTNSSSTILIASIIAIERRLPTFSKSSIQYSKNIYIYALATFKLRPIRLSYYIVSSISRVIDNFYYTTIQMSRILIPILRVVVATIIQILESLELYIQYLELRLYLVIALIQKDITLRILILLYFLSIIYQSLQFIKSLVRLTNYQRNQYTIVLTQLRLLTNTSVFYIFIGVAQLVIRDSLFIIVPYIIKYSQLYLESYLYRIIFIIYDVSRRSILALITRVIYASLLTSQKLVFLRINSSTSFKTIVDTLSYTILARRILRS